MERPLEMCALAVSHVWCEFKSSLPPKENSNMYHLFPFMYSKGTKSLALGFVVGKNSILPTLKASREIKKLIFYLEIFTMNLNSSC